MYILDRLEITAERLGWVLGLIAEPKVQSYILDVTPRLRSRRLPIFACPLIPQAFLQLGKGNQYLVWN